MTMTSNNQYDGQQLRKLWQEAVLPGADISDSPQRLMSLSRACRSVSALLQTGYPEWEGASAATCVRTGHGLFDLMLRKTGQNCPTADKLELISEMYGLLNGISPCPDQSRSRLWDEAAADALEAYFRDRAAMPAAREQTAACLCLLDWFYFMEDVEDEPWMQYLKATVNTWTASFNPEEGWKDTPTETALERIEVLSRNSYMTPRMTAPSAQHSSTTPGKPQPPLPSPAPHWAVSTTSQQEETACPESRKPPAPPHQASAAWSRPAPPAATPACTAPPTASLTFAAASWGGCRMRFSGLLLRMVRSIFK